MTFLYCAEKWHLLHTKIHKNTQKLILLNENSDSISFLTEVPMKKALVFT
jgi:hypothetical protein